MEKKKKPTATKKPTFKLQVNMSQKKHTYVLEKLSGHVTGSPHWGKFITLKAGTMSYPTQLAPPGSSSSPFHLGGMNECYSNEGFSLQPPWGIQESLAEGQQSKRNFTKEPAQ